MKLLARLLCAIHGHDIEREAGVIVPAGAVRTRVGGSGWCHASISTYDLIEIHETCTRCANLKTYDVPLGRDTFSLLKG